MTQDGFTEMRLHGMKVLTDNTGLVPEGVIQFRNDLFELVGECTVEEFTKYYKTIKGQEERQQLRTAERQKRLAKQKAIREALLNRLRREAT